MCKEVMIAENEIMVSYDVISLITAMPKQRPEDSIAELLEAHAGLTNVYKPVSRSIAEFTNWQ